MEERIIEKGVFGKIPEVHYSGIDEKEIVQVLLPGLGESADMLRITSTRTSWLLAEGDIEGFICIFNELERRSLENLRYWVFPGSSSAFFVLISFRSKPLEMREKIIQDISNGCSGLKKVYSFDSEVEALRQLIFTTHTGYPISIHLLRKNEVCTAKEIITDNWSQKGCKTLEDLILRIEMSGLLRIISLDSLLLNGEPIGLHAKLYIHPSLEKDDIECLMNSFITSINFYLKNKYGVELKERKVFPGEGKVVEILMS